MTPIWILETLGIYGLLFLFVLSLCAATRQQPPPFEGASEEEPAHAEPQPKT